MFKFMRLIILAGIIGFPLLLIGQDYKSGAITVEIKNKNAIPVNHENLGKNNSPNFQKTELNALFQGFNIQSFEKAYPAAKHFEHPNSKKLLQVYLIKGAFNANQLKNSLESNAKEFYKDVNRVSQPKLDHTPNDYGTNGGFTYSQGGLELIQAKNAWDITKGKEEIKIGVVEAQSFDNGFDTTHEDLKSQIAFIENGAQMTDYNHGTSVAGVAGAATNNNKGLSSIGYKNKLLLFEGSIDVNFTYYTSL